MFVIILRVVAPQSSLSLLARLLWSSAIFSQRNCATMLIIRMIIQAKLMIILIVFSQRNFASMLIILRRRSRPRPTNLFDQACQAREKCQNLMMQWLKWYYTLNILWTYSEHTLNILWTYPEDMPKIWQNIKNTNDWVTQSPKWIQEMLAHLKRCCFNHQIKKTLPKALRTQGLTALTSNVGLL